MPRPASAPTAPQNTVAPANNIYQHQAQQLTQQSALTTASKPEKLYRRAVERVLRDRAAHGIDDEQVQLITSKCTIDALLDEVRKAKETSRSSGGGKVTKLFKTGFKDGLATFERFEKAVDVMVQAGKYHMPSNW